MVTIRVPTSSSLHRLRNQYNSDIFGNNVLYLLSRSHDKTKPVHRLTASDKDAGENGTVSYSLPESRDRAFWRIDSITGELYLKADWPAVDPIIVKV